MFCPHLMSRPVGTRNVLRFIPFQVSARTPSYQNAKWPPRCSFSTTSTRFNDLFQYTSGRWIFNDALRHAERKRVFDAEGLQILAAESINRSPNNIVDFIKLSDGWSDRKFLITMDDGFQMVASIPYLPVEPKHLIVSSQVATMEFLRAQGFPIPKVYGYSRTSDNIAETEYIFMVQVCGTQLSHNWYDLGEEEKKKMVSQIAALESKMTSITFTLGGSLYFTDDLDEMGIPRGLLSPGQKFSIGPDLRLPLWFGRRALFPADRGPYKSTEEALVSGARSELMFLETFGQPLLPFKREKRASYQWNQQFPSEHMENLHRFLRIANSLIPGNSQNQFCIHPNMHPSNVFVDSDLNITGIVGWDRTSILPRFLHSSVSALTAQRSNDLVIPKLVTESLDWENAVYYLENWRELYHLRLDRGDRNDNPLCNASHEDSGSLLRRNLFMHASQPWEGDPLCLKMALIEATEQWDTLTGCTLGECPIAFDPEDVLKAKEMNELQNQSEEVMKGCDFLIGCTRDGWVPNDFYETSKEQSRAVKRTLMDVSMEEDAQIQLKYHWPYDDMDEDVYV